VDSVVDYVSTLSRPTAVPPGDAAKIGEGRAVFAENCAACHGEAGTGSMEVGAPDLTDRFWIYGGDRASIFATVWNGRQGHMPSWEGRLSAVERRILALYLADLRLADLRSAGP
jgi:cytochrome c oxidase cbb3-type subunit 3